MDKIEGYKIRQEQKKSILYARMDDSMIEFLKEIKDKTGISTSEIIREAVRQMIKKIKKNNSFSFEL